MVKVTFSFALYQFYLKKLKSGVSAANFDYPYTVVLTGIGVMTCFNRQHVPRETCLGFGCAVSFNVQKISLRAVFYTQLSCVDSYIKPDVHRANHRHWQVQNPVLKTSVRCGWLK